MNFGLLVLIALALTGGVWFALYWAARRHVAERQRLGQWDENGPLHPTEPDSRFPGFDPFEAGFRHAFEQEHGKPFEIQPSGDALRDGEPVPIDELPPGGSGPPFTERLRDMIRRGAGMRPLDPDELPDDYRADLHGVCEADPNVQAVWLAWITWPSAPDELLATLQLGRLDEQSVRSFTWRVDALGGPRCVASVVGDRPTLAPFHERAAESRVPMDADSPCPRCGHTLGDHVLHAHVARDQVTATSDGRAQVDLNSATGDVWMQCPVQGCDCRFPVAVSGR